MKKYDARVIRTAITAIKLYFLNVLITISSILEIFFLSRLLRVVIFQLSFYRELHFIRSPSFYFNSTYVLILLSVATGNQQVYTSFSYPIKQTLRMLIKLTNVIPCHFSNSPVYLCFQDLQIFSNSSISFLQNRRTFHLQLVGLDSL